MNLRPLHRFSVTTLVLFLVLCVTATNSLPVHAAVIAQPHTLTPSSPDAKNIDIALSFVPEHAQNPADPRFSVHAFGGTVQFDSTGYEIILPPPRDTHKGQARKTSLLPSHPQIIRKEFTSVDAGMNLTSYGESTASITIDSPSGQTTLPTYPSIAYQQMYPGISAVYGGDHATLSSTFLVNAGADPSQIRWQYRDAKSVSVDPASGELVVLLSRPAGLDAAIATTTLRESKPIAWQESEAGSVSVPVEFAVFTDGTIGFSLGAYDDTERLFIDPNTQVNDLDNMAVTAITVDTSGRTYAAGYVYDQTTDTDVVITVLDADGTILDTQKIDGSRAERPVDIALDADGSLIVAGWTSSPDIAVTSTTVPFSGSVCAEYNSIIYYCSNGFVARYQFSESGGAKALNKRWLSYTGENDLQAMSLRSDNLLVLAGDETGSSGLVIVTTLKWDATTEDYTQVSQRSLSGRGVAYVNDMTAGSQKDIYLVGRSWSHTDESGDNGNAWVARLDASGNIEAQVNISRPEAYTLTRIDRDVQGNIYVGGEASLWDESFPTLGPLTDGYEYESDGSGVAWFGFIAELTADLQEVYISKIAGGSVTALVVDSTRKPYLSSYRHSTGTSVLISVEPDGAAWGEEVVLQGDYSYMAAVAADVVDNIYAAGSGVMAKIGNTALPDLPEPSGPPPAYTTSYYVQTVDPEVGRYMGCLARQEAVDQYSDTDDGIVVLFFGRPKIDKEGNYGTTLIQARSTPKIDFVSTEQIEIMVKSLIMAYNNPQDCARDFGITIGSAGGSPTITLAISTTNAQEEEDENNDGSLLNPYLIPEHGQEWAKMVLALMDFSANGNYSVHVAGAFDAEPDWAAVDGVRKFHPELVSGRQAAIEWTEGFASMDASGERGLIYYNIGSTDGGARDSSWIDQDNNKRPLMEWVYQISAGTSAARLLPQIYHADFAAEWYQLVRYAKAVHGKDLQLAGVLTQAGSSGVDIDMADPWQESPLDVDWEDGLRVNFAPKQAWQAMYDVLHNTFVIHATLQHDWGSPLPDSFLVTPTQAREEEFATLLEDTSRSGECEVEYILYTSSAYTNPTNNKPKLPQPNNRVSSNSCFGAGMQFPVDSTFSQKFHLPPKVQTFYNTSTPQAILWSTDIAYSPYMIP